MDETGTLYVAPLDTPWPECAVDNGVFEDEWGTWEKLADQVKLELTTKPSRPRIDITCRTGRISMGRLSQLAGKQCRLGFEDDSRTLRTLYDKAEFLRGGTALFRRGSSAEIVFGFTAENGRIYQAATSPTLTPPYNKGGLVPTWEPRPKTPSLPAAAEGARGRGSLDLVPDRLRGYREFKVRDAAGPRPARLESVTAGTVWPWTPTNEARCLRTEIFLLGFKQFTPLAHDPDDVPNDTCTCGLYAKHKPITYASGDRIYGVIEAWGPTEFGDAAFRSRYARLVALYLCRKPADAPPFSLYLERARALGDTYKVPVFGNYVEMMEKFPPVDISALLGEEPEQRYPPCPRCEMTMERTFLNGHFLSWHCPRCVISIRPT